MWVAAAICLIAFAIQASEGDLTTDDNVSGGSWGQTQDTRTWGTEDIEHGTQDMRDIGWGQRNMEMQFLGTGHGG